MLKPFHGEVPEDLFDEEQQLYVAKVLASLLSPLKGSVIFGHHVGLPEKGMRKRRNLDDQLAIHMRADRFCHSPESWKELWDGEVFKKGRKMVSYTN